MSQQAEIVIEDKEQDPKPAPAAPIGVAEGALVPKDSSELNRVLANIAQGGGFPERFKTHPERVAAYNLAHSLMGGKWQLALSHIANVKGSLCIYGELPGALAEQTKEVQEKHVFALDAAGKKICMENGNLAAPAVAGVCIIQRKGREKKEFSYTLEEARKAGQYPSNEYSPWTKFTKIMLMRKAMSMAIKFEFPDALLGTPMAEYDYDQAPDLVKDVTPTQGEQVSRARGVIRRAKGVST